MQRALSTQSAYLPALGAAERLCEVDLRVVVLRGVTDRLSVSLRKSKACWSALRVSLKATGLEQRKADCSWMRRRTGEAESKTKCLTVT